MTYSALNERDTDRRSDGRGHPFRVIHSLRHTLVAFLIVGTATAALGAGTAVAAGAAARTTPPCWKVLINDWFDGRIDGIYEIHCYRDALQHLPADIDTYSSARDDIRQALQKRITQGNSGNSSAGGTSSGGGTAGGGTSGGGSSGGGSPAGGSSGGGTPGGGSSGGGNGSAGGPIPNAINNLGPEKADSLPVPLLVLGGVAVALMAAGGAGFLTRRTRIRRAQLASAASVPHGPAPRPNKQS
jgi:hypothetical protein